MIKGDFVHGRRAESLDSMLLSSFFFVYSIFRSDKNDIYISAKQSKVANKPAERKG